MIAVIRIRGRVGLDKEIKETFLRLGLKKKYSCIFVPERKDIIGMLKKVENFVAYGDINSKTLNELVEKRGEKKDKSKKADYEGFVKSLANGKFGKILEKHNIKPVFRLHPPRGGIESKKHFPKGVLGNNKEKINELIIRMV